MSERIIQCTTLGRFGRFGNQLFQYAFARAYAEKYDAILELPQWIGEKIFKNVSTRPISCSLPRTPPDTIPWGQVNIDLCGYFQTSRCFDILSNNRLREWFAFQDKWIDRFSVKIPDEIVAHRRLGDYVTLHPGVFCTVSKESYLRIISKLGFDEGDVTWLSEETPTKGEDEVCYSRQPHGIYGCGFYPDKGIGFLTDFFRMINAKILLRSNSTFGFWAGFFKGHGVYSPVVGKLVGQQDVDFVEGNESAICGVTDDMVII
jgi:hypothetical protein